MVAAHAPRRSAAVWAAARRRLALAVVGGAALRQRDAAEADRWAPLAGRRSRATAGRPAAVAVAVAPPGVMRREPAVPLGATADPPIARSTSGEVAADPSARRRSAHVVVAGGFLLLAVLGFARKMQAIALTLCRLRDPTAAKAKAK
eukprot:CAMPEP_0176134576 /NCGR_PEP_ID=MMETSP0120_2-20121206/68248_1 /TAXON_ID=160619 /ORGANISM="Kryptoperidinium foliaceum, Strain CCMP 1326" /LENGTH=146 /DNA_ID=CAMNT_0017470229 /DNA_START=46 /DNA_END=484 /DNA_ORIENTATION=+